MYPDYIIIKIQNTCTFFTTKPSILARTKPWVTVYGIKVPTRWHCVTLTVQAFVQS